MTRKHKDNKKPTYSELLEMLEIQDRKSQKINASKDYRIMELEKENEQLKASLGIRSNQLRRTLDSILELASSEIDKHQKIIKLLTE